MTADAAPDASPDPHGAFVPGPRHERAGGGTGRLSGLRFAVKDLIDVEGAATGAGNPDWLAGQSGAGRSAPVVAALLAAGADLAGKTLTDEIAFSLEGANAHYGTPRNPAAPGRLPGGSSSGSAVAVAAGLVDFALGTDTGGSVRVPAAFCGVFGFRPTHGRVPLDGVVPFAPGYDTLGWFARDGETLARIGAVLLGDTAPPPGRRLLAGDALALCDPATRDTLLAAAARWGIAGEVDIFDSDPADWLEAYRVLQGAEIWRTHGDWIGAAAPTFGEAIQARFDDAATITGAAVERWRPVRARIRVHLDRLLADDVGLIVPTAPCPALPIDASEAALGDFYRRALTLSAIAGHGGLPQVTVPVTGDDGLPRGLSLVAGRDRDAGLLSFVRQMA